MAERATAPDTVGNAIRRLEALDAGGKLLRATAPALAASLGTAARIRWTPIGYLPDLTTDEWQAAADENQARHRPKGRPQPAALPPAATAERAGPASVKYPFGDETTIRPRGRYK